MLHKYLLKNTTRGLSILLLLVLGGATRKIKDLISGYLEHIPWLQETDPVNVVLQWVGVNAGLDNTILIH